MIPARWLGVVVGLVALVATGCSPDPPAPAFSPAELAQAKQAAGIADCPASDPAVAVAPGGLPDVTVDCLGGGRPVRLAGLRGRPLLVNVWAQWCQPCQQEAPFIAELAHGNRSSLLVMGIDYDDPRPDRAIEFARVLTWRFPQAVDQARTLSGPLQLTGPPVSLFVRADGTIAYRHSGPFASTDELRRAVYEHLGVAL